MRIPYAQPERRDIAAGILLALFLLRAYVPAGFMPAAGAPFLLEICPTGMQGAIHSLQAHHHMAGHDMASHDMASHDMVAHDVGSPSSGGHADVEDCPFGCAPAAAPVSHYAAPASATQIVSEPVLAVDPVPAGVRVPRAHRARAPPALA